RPVPRPRCRSAKSAPTAASATVTAVLVRSAIVTAATADHAAPVKLPKELQNNGRHQPDPDPASLPSPPQDLPVLRRQRPEDRLQGRSPVAALHLRARQDRAVPHHGGQPEEAARTRPCDQARTLPRTASLCGEV